MPGRGRAKGGRSRVKAFVGAIVMAVTSVFGRDGDVVKAEGDYDLTDLGDVTITSPSDLQALLYNGTSSEWENATLVDSVAGADKQIQFNDGGSAFGADANFVWDKASEYLGVGTDAPSNSIEIYRNGSVPNIKLIGEGVTQGNQIAEIYSGTSANSGFLVTGRSARGSVASPTAAQSGDQLFALRGGGHNGVTNKDSQAFIVMVAAENWSNGTTGSTINFSTTPLGTSDTFRTSMQLLSGGILSVDAVADGDVVRIKQGGVQEGQITVSGNTVAYQAFVGAHPTQPTAAQQLLAKPPVGGVVVSNGDQIESELVVWAEQDGTDTRGVLARMRDSVINMFVGGNNDYLSSLKGKVHKLRLPDDLTDDERSRFVRKVVRVADKEIYVHVEPTTIVNDSRAYGVFIGEKPELPNDKSFGANNVPEWSIAGVGHYKVRVTDLGGNIANGDYLTTSTRAYEAQRQSDDVLHSYTVGKALIDVDWTTIEIDSQLGYKWALVPATLHCG